MAQSPGRSGGGTTTAPAPPAPSRLDPLNPRTVLATSLGILIRRLQRLVNQADDLGMPIDREFRFEVCRLLDHNRRPFLDADIDCAAGPSHRKGSDMSTHDVPGAKPENHDKLAMGCWAEHDDGSRVFVASTEAGRVVFEMFDTRTEPLTNYRHAMTEAEFKDKFTWKPDDDDSIEWTWHDKTPFDWDVVIAAGARPGVRHPSADAELSAAARVAESLDLRTTGKTADDFAHMAERFGPAVAELWKGIQSAIGKLKS